MCNDLYGICFFLLPLKLPIYFYILSSTGGLLTTWSSCCGAGGCGNAEKQCSAYTAAALLQLFWFPPTVPQKIWAFGWLESLICPEVRAHERRSRARFLPLTRWLLGLAPACPGTLMRNKRWLTENGWVEESDEMIMPSSLASRWAFNNFLLTQGLTLLLCRGPFLIGPPAAHIEKKKSDCYCADALFLSS